MLFVLILLLFSSSEEIYARFPFPDQPTPNRPTKQPTTFQPTTLSPTSQPTLQPTEFLCYHPISLSLPSIKSTSSVISPDGKTLFFADSGADRAHIYVSQSGNWVPYSSISPQDSFPKGYSRFGSAAVFNNDATVLVVGGMYDNDNIGAVWVFEKNLSIDKFYHQHQAKLVGSDYVASKTGVGQGISVACDFHCSTIAFGGYLDGPQDDYIGATWVFVRQPTTGLYVQDGPKLVGYDFHPPSGQGTSVALNAEGNYLLVGGMFDDNFLGAAWGFRKINDHWYMEMKLQPTNFQYNNIILFGINLAMNQQGTLAVISGQGDFNNGGSYWMFSREQNAFQPYWHQIEKITPLWSNPLDIQNTYTLADDYFGGSVAMNSDGTILAIGRSQINRNSGQVWMYQFQPSKGSWVQSCVYSGEEFNTRFGHQVSLSADGLVLITSSQTNGTVTVIAPLHGDPDLTQSPISTEEFFTTVGYLSSGQQVGISFGTLGLVLGGAFAVVAIRRRSLKKRLSLQMEPRNESGNEQFSLFDKASGKFEVDNPSTTILIGPSFSLKKPALLRFSLTEISTSDHNRNSQTFLSSENPLFSIGSVEQQQDE